MPQLDILHHQGKRPVPGMDYIYLSHWTKGPHGNSQTSQAVVKDTGCSPQTEDKALWMTMLLCLIGHRETELVTN